MSTSPTSPAVIEQLPSTNLTQGSSALPKRFFCGRNHQLRALILPKRGFAVLGLHWITLTVPSTNSRGSICRRTLLQRQPLQSSLFSGKRGIFRSLVWNSAYANPYAWANDSGFLASMKMEEAVGFGNKQEPVSLTDHLSHHFRFKKSKQEQSKRQRQTINLKGSSFAQVCRWRQQFSKHHYPSHSPVGKRNGRHWQSWKN